MRKFECDIKPRDEERARLIREDWEPAKNEFNREDATLDEMSFT
jgi:hypothetical protein